MFSVNCPSHRSDVLLGYSNLIGLENTEAGVVVHWRCYCGTVGRTLTGRPRRPTPV